MGRLIVLVLIACAVLRLLTGKWPWELWRSSQRSQDEAQARALLGVGRHASAAEITEAHRRLLVRVHPDKGGSNEAVHQANRAKEMLLARLARAETEQA